MDWLAGVAAVGAGVIGGVFFVFSVAVMPAFARLPAGHGIAVMQAINVTIVRPPFLVVFVGTGIASVVQVVLAPGELAGWVGAALYVLGSIGVTAALNVPLNNRLMATAEDDPDGFWPTYASRWALWNHVRTIAGIGAAAAFVASFAG
jgi:uncharacterized membrane protein